MLLYIIFVSPYFLECYPNCKTKQYNVLDNVMIMY